MKCTRWHSARGAQKSSLHQVTRRPESGTAFQGGCLRGSTCQRRCTGRIHARRRGSGSGVWRVGWSLGLARQSRHDLDGRLHWRSRKVGGDESRRNEGGLFRWWHTDVHLGRPAAEKIGQSRASDAEPTLPVCRVHAGWTADYHFVEYRACWTCGTRIPTSCSMSFLTNQVIPSAWR